MTWRDRYLISLGLTLAMLGAMIFFYVPPDAPGTLSFVGMLLGLVGFSYTLGLASAKLD